MRLVLVLVHVLPMGMFHSLEREDYMADVSFDCIPLLRWTLMHLVHPVMWTA